MTTLTIDRADHLTGSAFKVHQDSGLCRKLDGLMCCLGFYGQQLGLTKERMHNRGTLDGVLTHDRAEAQWLFQTIAESDRITSTDVSVQDALVSANDDFKQHPIRREARIKKLFKKYGGIDVVFKGQRRTATVKAKRALKSVGL